MTSYKCPKCENICEFQDGMLFGFCSKCGSSLEIGSDNAVCIYDKESETDENIMFSWERYDTCMALNVPIRGRMDFEAFNFEIERMMDEFMTFAEVEKDIFSSLDSMPEKQRLRTCQLCSKMINNLYQKFESFLNEYSDFGMADEMKALDRAYTEKSQALSRAYAAEQKKNAASYWADRQDEYNELMEALRKAKEKKSKVFFYDLKGNWEVDNEIAEIEAKLNRTG